MDPRIASVGPPFCMTDFASSKIFVKVSVGSLSLVLHISRQAESSMLALSLTMVYRQLLPAWFDSLLSLVEVSISFPVRG